MGLSTQDPYIQKEHTKVYKILKFGINWANIEQGTAIQNLKKLLKNVWIAGHLSGNVRKCLEIPAFLSKFLRFWMAVSCSILAQ